MKQTIKNIPVLGDWLVRLRRSMSGQKPKLKPKPFPGSANYWETRYASGGNSGVGSYDKFAEFKAEILNAFVAEHDIASVVEFGCGDGNQLTLASYPRYVGLDISETALSHCRDRFADDSTKQFYLFSEYDGEQADLALSLDVIFHLVEDDVYERYMRDLFSAGRRFVIIYSSNYNDDTGTHGPHVRHRRFTDWVEHNQSEWNLLDRIPSKYPYEGDYRTGSFQDFYVFARTAPSEDRT